MFDDLRRNFLMNPSCGLKVSEGVTYNLDNVIYLLIIILYL